MRRSTQRCFIGLLLWLTLLNLGACTQGRPPPELFLLQALASIPRTVATDPAKPPVIGVGPVRFPRYLDRSQIIIAQTGGWFVPQDDQRWAENLSDNFLRVLAENLAAAVPTDRVLIHPWPRTDVPDLKLTLRVNQFHWTENGLATLDARWELFDKAGLLVSRRTMRQIRAKDHAVAAGVLALSETVDALSQEIATSIRTFWHENPPPMAVTPR